MGIIREANQQLSRTNRPGSRTYRTLDSGWHVFEACGYYL